MPPEFDPREMQNPASVESERALIGVVFFDSEALRDMRAMGLTRFEFYNRPAAFVFEAMCEMQDARREINPLSLAETLRQKGQLEQAGGVAALSELTGPTAMMLLTGGPKAIEGTVKVVLEKAHLRDMLKTLRLQEAAILEGEEEGHILIEETVRAVTQAGNEALNGQRAKQGFTPARDSLPEIEVALEKLSRGISMALPTGVRPIDEMLEGGGFVPQGLYVMSARPKAGKTSLALNITHRIARRLGQTGDGSVAFLSLEMRRQALLLRLYAQWAGVAYSRLTRPGLAGMDYETLKRRLGKFFDGLALHVSDTVNNVSDLWAEGERLVTGHARAKLIVVDYLQLLALVGRKHKKHDTTTGKRAEEVSLISRELKAMAREFNVPLLAISSLNREVTAFASKDPKKKTVIRPELWHLRESGQMEFDAEAVFLLHNPDVFAGMSEEDRTLLNGQEVWNIVCDVAAQRNGPTGDIPLKFRRDRMEFMSQTEYDREIGRAKPQQRFTGPEPDFGGSVSTNGNRPDVGEIPF